MPCSLRQGASTRLRPGRPPVRERRWESRDPLTFEAVLDVADTLQAAHLAVRGRRQEGACYFEEFWIEDVADLDRLDAWPVEEVTLIEVVDDWAGDFFVLAGEHHEAYRARPAMEAYLSLCHPWRLPPDRGPHLHHDEGMFWIGFRNTHGFIRARVIPREIITPGETRGDSQRDEWVRERAEAWTAALDVLELPLFVDWSNGVPEVGSADPGCRIASSWPDAFGPCQFEYVVADRYELLVPAARLVERLGRRPATLRTFLSGWSPDVLDEFHRFQPASQRLYRGYVHACLLDLPELVDTIAPHGRVLSTLCEFRTGEWDQAARDAYAVVGAMAGPDGYRIEVRLSRAPRAEEEMEGWVEQLVGRPMRYAPLAWY